MSVLIVIPARMGSERFYGKPLYNLLGKPMIEWVWERAKQIKGIDDVIVATDSEQIKNKVKEFGGKSIITSKDCLSGTDRVAEIAEIMDADYYVNLQGDEPTIDPKNLEALINSLVKGYEMVTLDFELAEEDAKNPDIVKVVKDINNFALYFSRSPIPYPRNLKIFRKHIGIYGYKKETLFKLVSLPPSPLEKAEGLEQLRALYNGIKIYVEEALFDSISVDTIEDAKKAEEYLKRRKN